jgi:FHA domain
MRTELHVVTGAERGQVFDLADGQNLRIGRNPDMDICLSGMTVSRHHCEVVRQGDKVLIRDVGSTNGTAVSSIARIGAPQLLQPDDVIRLCETVLVFRQHGPMTEAQWFSETNPHRLLGEMRRRFGARKLKLYGLAWCRLSPHFDNSPVSGEAVRILRQFADNETLVDVSDLQTALIRLRGLGRYIAPFFLPEMDEALFQPEMEWNNLATNHGTNVGVGGGQVGPLPLEQGLSYDPCDLIRELSGNPYRAVALDPLWLRWSDGCIGKMVRHIYEEECFGDLPILADALEEAGCNEGPLLDHLRQHKVKHVRGCWVVDLIMDQHRPAN